MARDGTVRSGTVGHRGQQSGKRPDPPDLSVVRVNEADEADDGGLAELLRDNPDALGVYTRMMAWLADRGCTTIQVGLVEEYARATARWRQVEKIIETDGFISPHPTTGADMASPLVGVANTYFKQMHAAWYAIWDVVKQTPEPAKEMDDMEKLLSSVG